MIIDSIKFRGYRCFKNDWVGFETVKPVNVIIGRNNSGKSHLLDLVAALCDNSIQTNKWNRKCAGVLDESSLRSVFREHVTGGALGGRHWQGHGIGFVNNRMSWEIDHENQITVIQAEPCRIEEGHRIDPNSARLEMLKDLAKKAVHRFHGLQFRRLFADRDIQPELEETGLNLNGNGRGATNIIRRYIVSAKLGRELIQKDLLEALKEIFGPDGDFNEILVKQHDEVSSGTKGHWEVYLGEKKKDLVALSNSGSGLKTVILVLLDLLVIPKINNRPKNDHVFAFEELENNLHPALLRRLFKYLEKYAVKEKSTIFLTTHSSTALDLFGLSENAQIIHVTHDRESARAGVITAHFEHLGVISDLGAKPSDLLQANGIVWVEGPSDRIYINRWLSLITNGRLREGRDYQCAFYGGALLARTQFMPPENQEAELVNLFRVNSNIVVVCDSDQTEAGAELKERVKRIRAEVSSIPNSCIWVTGAKEIENYIPGSALVKALGIESLPDPGQFETFFPRDGNESHSYVEGRIGRKSLQKMNLAMLCIPHMEREAMNSRFDWATKMEEIVHRIESWNR